MPAVVWSDQTCACPSAMPDAMMKERMQSLKSISSSLSFVGTLRIVERTLIIPVPVGSVRVAACGKGIAWLITHLHRILAARDRHVLSRGRVLSRYGFKVGNGPLVSS